MFFYPFLCRDSLPAHTLPHRAISLKQGCGPELMPLESFRVFKTISRSSGLPHWPPPATSKGSQQPSSTSVPLGSHQLLPHIPYQGPISSRAGQEDDRFLHRGMKKNSHLHQILEIPRLSLKAPAQYLYMYVYACVSSFCRAAGARGAQADLSKAHTP